MPGPYTYDARVDRYRSPRGNYVPRKVVRRALDRSLDTGGGTARALSEQLRDGKLGLKEWQSGMARLIKNAHIQAAGVARGGLAQMSAADYGRLGQAIKMQYRYLQRLATLVEQGLPMDGDFLRRAAMYPQSARQAYHTTERQQLKALGFDQKRNIAEEDGRICDGCQRATDAGWVPIDQNDADVPEIGYRDCLTNCRCRWDYQNSATGETTEQSEPTPQEPVEPPPPAADPELPPTAERGALPAPPPPKFRKAKDLDGIKSYGYESKLFREGIYTTTPAGADRNVWGRSFGRDSRLLEHWNRIGAEWARMRAAYPNMPNDQIDYLVLTDVDRGRASFATAPRGTRWLAVATDRDMSPDVWRNLETWERSTGRRWAIEFRKGERVEANFRHEYGHALTSAEVKSGWEALRAKYDPEWFKLHVSEYASTNAYEEIAETFAMVTARGYVRGTLPADIEDFFFKQVLRE